MKKWLTTPEGRKWIYNVTIAALSTLALVCGINAAVHESLELLAAAILNVGGAASNVLARQNIQP